MEGCVERVMYEGESKKERENGESVKATSLELYSLWAVGWVS